MTRVDFEPGDRPGGLYRLLNSVVVPRPIAWVSTRSAGGVDNLAPHSFFTVACADPAVVQFTSIGRKDSLANATATGEFVVNLAPEPLFEQVNATATDFPPDHDEFAEVGLEREPSRLVAPPRVAGSPVALPVTMTASARKNSAARAVSASDTSAVSACAACFFLMSANTRTPSAPIARR